MDKQRQLKELELKQQELIKQQNEVAQMIKKLKDNKKWQPEMKDLYFYVNSAGDVCNDSWYDIIDDNFRLPLGNCFQTEEKAQQYLENLKTKAKLRQLAEELNGAEEIDWEDEEQRKFYIFYNHMSSSLGLGLNPNNRYEGITYCLDPNFVNKAVKKIGEEKLIEMLKSGV